MHVGEAECSHHCAKLDRSLTQQPQLLGSLGVKPPDLARQSAQTLTQACVLVLSRLQLVAQLLHLVGLLGLDVCVEFPERGARHPERRATG